MKKWLILSVSLLAADLIGCYIFYRVVQDFISKQPSELKAEVAVVFQRNIDWEHAQPGTGTMKRLDNAISLYKGGNIDWIICVGASRPEIDVYGPKLMKGYLVENGLIPDNIICDSVSYDTETNWAEAKKIATDKGSHTIVAVSSLVHVYRISKIVDADNVVYSAYQYEFNSISDIWFVYYSIHYEWLAYIAEYILPQGIYHKVLRPLRRENIL